MPNRRKVPKHIERPEYLFHEGPEVIKEGEVKDLQDLPAIRRTNQLAAKVLHYAGTLVKPGITTDQIDAMVHDYIIEHDAYPSPLGYMGFPKSICTSVNEVICHGIPDDKRLRSGDIVNIDVTVYKEGFHGDTNATFPVGYVDDEAKLLLERTKESLNIGIEAVQPGRPVNVIGTVISAYARRFKYGVVKDFTGHGIGRAFHTGLIIPHFNTSDYADIIEENMVFTIEPMLNLGTHRWRQLKDGWTVKTKDGKLSAQFEHTVLVTSNGAEILTKLDS